eukprot:s5343_g5.t1
MESILKTMIRVSQATTRDSSDDETLAPEQAAGSPAMTLPTTPRRWQAFADTADGAKETSAPVHQVRWKSLPEELCSTPLKPPRLSTGSTCSTCCSDGEETLMLLNVLHVLAPQEPILGISSFLGVDDMVCFRRTCGVLCSPKSLVHHCERLLDLSRDDVLWTRAEMAAMEIRGCDDDEIEGFRNDNPKVAGPPDLK